MQIGSVCEMWKRKHIHKDAGKRSRPNSYQKVWKMGRRHLGGRDPVRRIDRQGEVLIWCRKCSGYARQGMGQKLINCCKPEQTDKKEHGKMLKKFQTLGDGRVPAKEAKYWRIEGQKKRITRKEH